MRISHQHRFVFFAYPKTGSRSVRGLLDAHAEVHGCHGDEVSSAFPFYNHMRPVELQEVFEARGWDYEGYFKFVMVRNPWSRLVSVFEMKAFREGGHLSRLRTRGSRHGDFRKWARALNKEEWKGGDGAVPMSVIGRGALPYLSFVGDEVGNVLVDMTIKLEEIEAQIPPLLLKLGLEAPKVIPRTGKGRYRGSFREYYDDETRDLIGEVYREEIERFGYTF